MTRRFLWSGGCIPASHKVLERNGFVAVGELTLNGKPAMSYICELR